MKHTRWTVIEGDNRPAGPPDKCFYCGARHGDQHRDGCVIRRRTIVVRTTIERVVAVPEDWTPQTIEFHHNDSSRCCDNDVAEIGAMLDRLQSAGGCTCPLITTIYLREATLQDEARSAWPESGPHQRAGKRSQE